MATTIQFTDIAIQQINASFPCNLAYGHTKWLRASDGKVILYPYNTNGQPLRGQNYVWTGHTWICESPSSTTYHNGAETDLSIDGTVIDMNAIDQSVNWLDTEFADVTKTSGIITKVKQLLVYSIKPTVNCFNKTIRWIRSLFALIRRNEDGSIRYDSNGEYIIDNE